MLLVTSILTWLSRYCYVFFKLTKCFIVFYFILHAWFPSLFREKTIAWAAVCTRYVIDACDRVQSIILLPHMIGASFVHVVLTGLIVSKPKHWVTWSRRTGVNLPFLRGKESSTLAFLLNHLMLNSILLVVQITSEKSDSFVCLYIFWRN